MGISCIDVIRPQMLSEHRNRIPSGKIANTSIDHDLATTRNSVSLSSVRVVFKDATAEVGCKNVAMAFMIDKKTT